MTIEAKKITSIKLPDGTIVQFNEWIDARDTVRYSSGGRRQYAELVIERSAFASWVLKPEDFGALGLREVVLHSVIVDNAGVAVDAGGSESRLILSIDGRPTIDAPLCTLTEKTWQERFTELARLVESGRYLSAQEYVHKSALTNLLTPHVIGRGVTMLTLVNAQPETRVRLYGIGVRNVE